MKLLKPTLFRSALPIIAATFAAGPLHADNILFVDTFDRPDSTTTNGTGLNESTDGKSGILGALTWTGKTELFDIANIVDVNGNRLRMDAINTNGNNGGFAYISDHNFIDASIKSAGTFTVSVDIVSTSSAGDGRHIGFGVGSSLFELDDVISASTGSNPSDVYFYYDNIGASVGLRVIHGGVAQGGLIPFPIGTPTAPTTPDTLSATFTFADMNAGTELNYELFLDGISVVTGSTTWSGTDENYLCLASSHSNPSFLDNFSVSLPGPPVLLTTDPATDAVNIEPSRTLLATFDEEIQLGATGSITIKNLTTSTDTVISLPGPDADGTLSVTGNELTIDPTADLGVAGDELAIEISADAIKDLDDAFYAGILATDDPNWSFTIDNIPPVPDYFQPIPGSDQAPLDGALFIAFGESPIVGSGNIEVYKADGTLVETIDVTSGDVLVSDARVTITPTVPLGYGTSYYVLIDSGAFTDALGNVYGISDSAEWTFTTIANEPAILFGDSYNRPDGNDLNASTSGKYGSLGALDYISRLIGVANVELSSGQLLLQPNENNGNSGALVYMDHNFTDAAITTAGGFSITVDINAYATGGTGRYMSVAMGQSSAELDGQTTASASSSAVGDLVVGYRDNNSTLYILENGTAYSTSDLPTPPTRMRIDCSLPDFNFGSTVEYEVFFDDSATPFTSGTFTWSGTDENYISLSSNLIQTFTPGVRNSLFDNLQIRSKSEAVASGYSSWASLNGASLNLEEDHDADGVSNGIEYFIGGPNGNTTGFTAVPGVTAGTAPNVTWAQAADYAGNYGTDFVIEVSGTLAADSWTDATTSGTPGVAGTVFIDGDNVTYTFPTGTKQFARLKVTGP